jgi:hypothetical protein
MNMQATRSAFDTDAAAVKAATTGNRQELIAHAVRASGKSAFEIGRDMMRHARSGRGIEPDDYVRYRLWDDAAHAGGGADRFVGARTVWPKAFAVGDKGWWAAAEDKWAMQTLLAADGLPLPESVAVIDRTTARSYPGLARVETVEALRRLVLEHPPGSLFLKVLDGMVGGGVVVIEEADAEGVRPAGGARTSWQAFLESTLGERSYLVQRRAENHAALAPFCTGLTTIRLPTFVEGRDIFVPCAAMKLATGGNLACAFWREGNLACEIDLDTGTILRVAGRKGPEVVELPDHPEVAGLKGLTLPFWDEVRALNEAAARVFAAIPYQSTDIALTPEGPLLVELNFGGSFDILQNATGRGLLTPEVRSFFERRGAGFARPQRKKRLGIF